MFKIFKKPYIKARLIKNGEQARVSVRNATTEQTMILLYMTIKQVAKSFGMSSHRQLMNGLLDLDRRIERNRKDEEHQAKYGKPRRKNKRK